QAELQLGPQWKVAPLDELLAKLRDYFGKDNIYIEYQVKSKAAKAAEPARPQTVASPPADMTMDDALDLYQSEVS
ncbi:nucleic acid-binding protein, partial [Acinetobacter baumannii]|nr:nucleic acid-binding protein [Acinetobacter baumannii]